jgi:hypothetical protein
MKHGWFLVLGAAALFACGGESESGGSGGSGGGGGTPGGSGGSGGSAGAGASGGSAGAGASGGSAGAGASGGGAGAGGAGGSAGAGGATSVDCDPSTVTCKAMTPICPKGEAPTVENGCWGKCVPVLSCAPIKDCTNCKNGFCAAYAAFTTEYRCLAASVQCSALACSCLADYFCAAPFSACTIPTSGAAKVSCECPNC